MFGKFGVPAYVRAQVLILGPRFTYWSIAVPKGPRTQIIGF